MSEDIDQTLGGIITRATSLARQVSALKAERDALSQRVAELEKERDELVQINLTTEGQRAYLKQRCADAELSLHAFDPSGTSEYWLSYSGPSPHADGANHG